MRWRWWTSTSDLTTEDADPPPPPGDNPVTAAQLEQLGIRVRHLEELRVRVSRIENRLNQLSVDVAEVLERIGKIGGTQGGPQ